MKKTFLNIIIPKPIMNTYKNIKYHFIDKNCAELSYWNDRFKVNSGTFQNAHYEKFMLEIAAECTQEFIKDKVVADFGCGPRGSLFWARAASLRIGIDVLADKYVDNFKNDLTTHEMIYLKSTEKSIPLPSDFVDVMFTLNAIDHVDNFQETCAEIIRVIKPGGLFIGSFNLEEPTSPCEPQQLSEKSIRDSLLSKLNVQSYRLAPKGPREDIYLNFFDPQASYQSGQEGILWVRASKPGINS